MARLFDTAVLTHVLPGEWVARASSDPYWSHQRRSTPRGVIELIGDAPLKARLTWRYAREDKGERELVIDLTHAGHTLLARGRGRASVLRHDAAISRGVHPDVIALHSAGALRREASVTILAREGVSGIDARAAVARDPEAFELTTDAFAKLRWLPDPAVNPAAT